MDNPLKAIQNELATRKDALSQAVTEGSIKDYATYREVCGEIRGLSFAHMYITDLVRKMEENE